MEFFSARRPAVVAAMLAVLWTAGCSTSSGGNPGDRVRTESGVSQVVAEAAEKVDQVARYQVARGLFDRGDTAAAWPLACQAAIDGDEDAQRLVAEYYWRGHPPVTKDLDTAFIWYSWAERKRPAESVKRVEVAMEMSPERVAAASQAAKDQRPDTAGCGLQSAQNVPPAQPAAAGPKPAPRPKPKG